MQANPMSSAIFHCRDGWDGLNHIPTQPVVCGLAVLWSCGPVVSRSCVLAVLWSCGLVVLWSCGPVVRGPCSPCAPCNSLCGPIHSREQISAPPMLHVTVNLPRLATGHLLHRNYYRNHNLNRLRAFYPSLPFGDIVNPSRDGSWDGLKTAQDTQARYLPPFGTDGTD